MDRLSSALDVIAHVGNATDRPHRLKAWGLGARNRWELLLEQARARSAVFDVLTSGVPVSVSMGSVK